MSLSDRAEASDVAGVPLRVRDDLTAHSRRLWAVVTALERPEADREETRQGIRQIVRQTAERLEELAGRRDIENV